MNGCTDVKDCFNFFMTICLRLISDFVPGIKLYAYIYYDFSLSHFLQQLDMAGEWRHGLFNYFDDLDLCIIAYFVPRVLFYVLYDFSLISHSN